MRSDRRERSVFTTEQDGVVGALLGSDGMASIERMREMMTTDGERIVAVWF